MPDLFLSGNGEACLACAFLRDELRTVRAMGPWVPCNHCSGIGRSERDSVEIIREAVLWAFDPTSPV